ncbi:MAG: hypothetical protein ACTHL1_10635 [Burkholderiaceae bacterium]
MTPPDPVRGIVWQPDNATARPHGDWERLGAHALLVQWTAVDGLAFVENAGLPTAPVLPDWERIAGEPWARDVILGLAGRFNEAAAREDVAELAALSRRLAALPSPLHVVGWYFPVEVDPTWKSAPRLASLLAPLPRPLWISVYDTANIGPEPLADWLATWLPEDVGILFQDGVGVYARSAAVARDYAKTLVARFGRKRVKIIAEAFRPAVGGGFRSARVEELAPQLAQYDGFEVFLFDGPHYLNPALTDALAKLRKAGARD